MPNADILYDSPAALANFSIGQELLSTPLHLARMTAAVASGEYSEPCLIKCVMPYKSSHAPSVSARVKGDARRAAGIYYKEMIIKTVQSGAGLRRHLRKQGRRVKPRQPRTGIPKSNGQTVDQA